MIEDPNDFKFQKKHEYDWDYVEEEVFNKSDFLDGGYKNGKLDRSNN